MNKRLLAFLAILGALGFLALCGIVAISFTPVLVLFWPERASARPVD